MGYTIKIDSCDCFIERIRFQPLFGGISAQDSIKHPGPDQQY